MLLTIQSHCKLGVVTNCSARLGNLAAQRLGINWDTIVTSEEAGYYKPDPRPYERALHRLGVTPQETAFVAGSGFDMFGTARTGLRTYWHNRVGLSLPPGAPPPEVESPTLDGVTHWLSQFQQSRTTS